MHVAAGFEPVRELLDNSPMLRDGGAAFAAYVDGELVVDAHAGVSRPGVPWRPDNLAVLMSITKSFAAMCIQILDDRGEIDLDAKVARYWPEFAAAGKAEVTVRQVMRHSAGAITVPPQLELLAGDGNGWDAYDAIAEAIAAQPPAWPPGTKHGYHALTFGWLVAEIVRRITGRSAGDFFRNEVVKPLDLDIVIGADDADLARVALVTEFDTAALPYPMRKMMETLSRKMCDPTTPAGMAFAGNGTDSVISRVVDLVAHGGILRAEVLASSGLATAPALAKFFGILALGGEVDGKRIVSADSVRKWTIPEVTSSDYVSTSAFPSWLVTALRLERLSRSTRTLGYLYNNPPARGPRPFGPTPTAVGGMGAGGQVGFADPVRRVSCGFVRTALSHKPDFGNQLIAKFYECLDGRS
ncbi:MAG TPA: serine hydrolase domain-containing protein [Mycobacteriales bacterium]|nr:serine hydrolase domain-containing protein [Mycobacteriales bacterium]